MTGVKGGIFGSSLRMLPIHDRRDDVQGLRAVAVVLVVAFHLWPTLIPGGYVGVDVFFVISGFLITRNLLTQPPRGRRDVVAFWGRRVRRLLPAAFLVLGVTLFASRFLAPETEWIRTARESVASAFYVENWLLVRQATDYLAPVAAPTPVQHYWSLSVEEQFYLVWPLLLIVATWLAGHRSSGRGWAVRGVARALIAVVLAGSLALSLATTAADPAGAYFMTTTRIWELAAGGLLATWISPVRLPITRAVGSWVGLGMIGFAALSFDTSTPWPGDHALVPVLGAMAFIWSASGSRWSPGVVFGTREAQWLGDASYSVYLWHWPILVLAPYAVDRDLTLADKLVVVVLTLALSWATLRWVENRWRIPHPAAPDRRPFQLAAVGAAAVMTIAGAQVLGVHLTERAVAANAADRLTSTCFGAAALGSGEVCPQEPESELVPAPATAVSDRAAPFDDGCMDKPPYDDARTCTYGHGSIKVALVGNSHAAHWLPALQQLAETHDLTITTYLVTVCSTVDAPLAFDESSRTEGCERWRDRTLAATEGDAYDLVITSQRSVVPVVGHTEDDTYQPWVDGMRRFLSSWSDTGTPVMVIRDTPYPGASIDDVPRCVAENPTDAAACSGPRTQWVKPDPLAAAAEGLRGVEVVDLSDRFCSATTCDGVNGGVLTYFDASHLTATYARTLAPFLAPALDRAIGPQQDAVPVSASLD